MVFKRRDKRAFWKIVAELVWPRGGWTRAFHYTRHRLRRLPDSPEKIARGIGVGVFTVFTPFYGLHFPLAALLSLIFRGNVIAALLATFVGNPLTFVPISVISLQTGFFILNLLSRFGIGTGVASGFGRPAGITDVELSTEVLQAHHRSIAGKFIDAAEDLKDNLLAVFTDAEPHWVALYVFYHDVFLPYLVGSIIPGTICGVVAYYLTVPVIRAYQTRRRGTLKAKLAAIRAKSGQGGKDGKGGPRRPKPGRKA